MRLAIIRNPRSTRNHGKAPPAFPHLAEPTSTDELTRFLRAFRDDGTDLLAIDGGDGTVREVLTALVGLGWGPRLALLPSGKINLIAGDAGWPSLAPLIEACRSGWDGIAVERRPLLRLDRTGQQPVYGMFVGAAAFTAGWHLANRHLHPRGLTSGPAIAAALALTLAKSRGKLAQGVPMRIAIDGGPPLDGNRFLFLATTLERLCLGLWPFWEEGAGGVHLLDVQAPPRRLLAALPSLATGKPRPWMRDEGYLATNASVIEIRASTAVVMDGEAFLPGDDDLFRLSAGPVLEFTRP